MNTRIKNAAAALAFVGLLLFGLPAQAVDFVFPGQIPSVCSGSGDVYSCGVLSIDAGDTITFNSLSPVIVNFTGAFTSGNNTKVNAEGAAADLTFNGAGVLTIGDDSVLNANVNVIGAGTIGARSLVGGYLSATTVTGVLTVGANSRVNGLISTDSGAVNLGAAAVVGGGVTTIAGVVTAGAAVKIGGNISTVAGAITVGDSSTICGDVGSTGAGIVTLDANIKIGGNIHTTAGAITVAAGSAINGNIISTNGGVITLTGVLVGGNISTVGPAITLTSSRVHGTALPIGAVTLTSSTVNDGALSILSACPAPFTSAVASAFECLETGLAYSNIKSIPAARNPLYTKLAGTAFAFDLVALKTDGTVEANFVVAGDNLKNVTLELVDGSGTTACVDRVALTPGVSQTVSFTSAELIPGRKTATSFTVNKAYANLRCRVTDSSQMPKVLGCSSDNFSVRPTALGVSSSANADAAGASVSAQPAVKAGAVFALTATSNVVGTNTQPKIDPAKVAPHVGSVKAGVMAGVFGNANPVTGVAPGAAFAYSEVGYFKLDVGGVYDDSFTSVDTTVGLPADCTDDFSNVPVGGKYGCKFGNAAPSNYFGRFIADHFAVSPKLLTPGCGAFTYFGQDFTTEFTLTAQNAANLTTQNYNGSFAKLDLTDDSKYGFSAAAQPAGATLGIGIGSSTPALPALQGQWANGEALVTAKHKINRPGTPTVELSFSVTAMPNDGEVAAASALPLGDPSPLRYGRIKLSNTYGSERLPLKMPLAFEYWTSNGWQKNSLDSCSAASLSSSNFAFEFSSTTTIINPKAPLKACDTAFTTATLQGNAPAYYVTLRAPNPANAGWANVALNLGTTPLGVQCTVASPGDSAMPLGMPWLQNTDPLPTPKEKDADRLPIYNWGESRSNHPLNRLLPPYLF